MLMTEKQAQRTWCPFVGHGRATEHMGRPPAEGSLLETRSCIGHRCAAWRWKTDPDAQAPTHLYHSTGERWSCEACGGTGEKDGGACPECDGEGQGTRKGPVGYCGLAGPVELVL